MTKNVPRKKADILFEDVSSDPKHLSKVWEHFKLNKSSKEARCDHCKAIIKISAGSTSGMRHHLSRIHLIKIDKSYKPLVPKEIKLETKFQVNTKSTKRSLECPICCLVFSQQFSLSTHLETHLQMYMKTQDQNQFEITKHKEGGTSLETLKNGEILQKNLITPLVCKICKISFKTKDNLRKHRLVHDHVKPFSCKTCHKSFKRKANLKSHQLIHEDNKPLSCEFCAKKFRHLATLNYHVRIHTGETPYSCFYCGKKFRRLRVKKNHEKSHREK